MTKNNSDHQALKNHLLDAIAKAQPPHGMTTKIVGIDGGGGAGKSTLAKHLSEWLGNVPVVITDDFAYWGLALLDRWPRLIEQVLEPLSHNQPAHYQRYDWGKLELADWHDLQPGGTVILEGVTSTQREFRPYLTYKIWVETSAKLRLKRGISRDRGIAGENNREQWLNWQAAENEYFQRDQPALEADLIVHTEGESYDY
jgi:uridine kinase